ncbi:SRPBCC family protein [Conexibacter arvalis]|uniref:Uncharacterized protein YndB with AHSA1/START domain n=1 Tax=Conexibacter arvalis TaxID=912552 RepID=A0A840I7E4_9ACTN|nr:SRPBCC family protein [Conexibacter arvalis]MBB4660809.1 uncharacterized protein YndB with AHSA1/START domain [Conexibacter arvalis]
MAADQIEREVRIAAPVERVWALVTEPEHVGRWFGDAGAEIDLHPGGAMTLTWAEHGTTRCVVERVEPPHRFSYRWMLAGGEGAPTEGNSTLVEFSLRADGDETLLKVVERGFATLAIPEEERVRHHAGNVEGWRMELDELVAYARQPAAR